MKIMKEQLNEYFNENKESLYYSNIKVLNGLVLYSMLGLILFSIGAFVTFDSNKSFWLNVAYGMYFTALIIIYFVSKFMMKYEVKKLAATKTLVYTSIVLINIFIIVISVFITGDTVRPLYFLLINVLTPTIFILKKKEIFISIILPAVIFVTLSYFYRPVSFIDDIYISASSIVIGIPFNLLLRNVKLEGAYIRGLYQKQANTDALTNIPNRRAFNAQVKASLNTKVDKSLLLVIIDLDKMKDINDNYGHQYGDLAIKGFAEKLEVFALENQLFTARIGGDEFVVIGLHYHERQVEEVLSRITKLPDDILINDDLKITVSVGGYFTKSIKDRDFDDIFNEADKVLYSVKNGNRNGYKLVIEGKNK